MNRQAISRRALFALGGSAAALALSSGWLGRAVAAPIDVITALTRPRNLIAECKAFIVARHAMDSPDAKMGSPATGRPPGPRIYEITMEHIRASKAFFEVPARCRDDVLLKYAMLEAYGYRPFYFYCRRTSGTSEKRPFWEWYEQLDADIEAFGVAANPWWREGAPRLPMINGQRAAWRDGAWYTDERLIRRLLPPADLV